MSFMNAVKNTLNEDFNCSVTENGALVSGFSTNVCKMVMSGKTDPYECLVETLMSDRYDAVEVALG